MNREYRWRSLWAVLFAVSAVLARTGLAYGQPPSGAVTEQHRFALVIGNADYKNVRQFEQLDNPVHDADVIADLLEGLKFKVRKEENTTKNKMVDAIKEVAAELNAAATKYGETNIVFVLYYSGHGVTYENDNWLLPVDIDDIDEKGRSLEFDAVQLSRILHQFPDKSIKFVFLDACRDNPFKKLRATGFTKIDFETPNIAIQFATKTGKTAQDSLSTRGDIPNSPFAWALANHLGDPNKSYDEIKDLIGKDVFNSTHEEQRVEFTSDLTSEFYFNPALTQAVSESQRFNAGNMLWESIKNSTNPEEFRSYLVGYPNGTFAPTARSKLAELVVTARPVPARQSKDPRREAAWREASTANSIDAFRRFLSSFPNGPYAEDAQLGLNALLRKPGRTFSDCSGCPEMIVLPPGGFLMGSPPTEAGRNENESPQHRITIARSIAVSRYDVTRAQYAAFAADTKRPAGTDCKTDRSSTGIIRRDPSATWSDPGFLQKEDEPVVCVDWSDAKAYVAWLNNRVSGQPYRLLSEAEWEYAARAGSAGRFSNDSDEAQLCTIANHADAGTRFPGRNSKCEDRAIHTSPVGAYKPNAFGLYDMLGNVWQWVEDCYEASLDQIPADGVAHSSHADCPRVNRGGGWFASPQMVRLAARSRVAASGRSSALGFRVARSVP